MKLLGTFTKNTDQLIEKILEDVVPDYSLLNREGNTTYDIRADYCIFEGDEKLEYPFFNNVFIVLKTFDKSMYTIKKQLNWLIGSSKSAGLVKELVGSYLNNSVRIQFYKDKETITFDAISIDPIELKFEKIGFEINRAEPEHEFWFVENTIDETGWFGFRISKHEDYHAEEFKGVLRPEICYLMNYLSDPSKDDVVLDPFAGSGSILKSRLHNFSQAKLIAFDTENTVEKDLLKQIEFIQEDFLTSTKIDSNSINKIVSDPPWGHFDQSIDVKEFYRDMFIKFKKILTKDGNVVLLIARDLEYLVEELANKNGFKIEEKFFFKVWGRAVILWKLVN